MDASQQELSIPTSDQGDGERIQWSSLLCGYHLSELSPSKQRASHDPPLPDLRPEIKPKPRSMRVSATLTWLLPDDDLSVRRAGGQYLAIFRVGP